MLLHPRPLLRREPLRRGGVEHAGDRLDVPQARPSGGEHRRRGGLPRRVLRTVEPDPGRDPLRGDHPTPGLEPLPSQQIRERSRRGSVTARREHPPSLQPGHCVHGRSVQTPHRALTQLEHCDQLVVTARHRRRRYRIDRLPEQALRDSESGFGHGYILPPPTDNSGCSWRGHANNHERFRGRDERGKGIFPVLLFNWRVQARLKPSTAGAADQ